MHINISAGFARYCAAAVLSLFLLGCGGGGGSETRSYSIGGEVSGLAGTLVLRNNDGDDLAIDDNGPFTFATSIAEGANYAVPFTRNRPTRRAWSRTARAPWAV